MTKRIYPHPLAALTAEVLERDGWCQGWGQGWGLNLNGERCLMAAVSYAIPNVADGIAMTNLLERHCNGSVVVWNDKPGRTKDEVLDMLASIPE